MKPRGQAGVESAEGWEQGRVCDGHLCRVQPGSAGTTCWPHGRDTACRAHLSLCMAAAGNALWGGWVGTGKRAMGQAVPQTPHGRWGNTVPRASYAPTCASPALGPHHVEGGSWLSVQPPHPACHRDIAAHHTTHPSDVMLHHCSDIPSRAAATSITGAGYNITLTLCGRGLVTPQKAPQSSDNKVTSQQPMTSCCMCPSNIIFLFLPFPGCHSCTRQGRGQGVDVPQTLPPLSHSSCAAQGCQQCPLHSTSAPSSPAPAVPLLQSEPIALDLLPRLLRAAVGSALLPPTPLSQTLAYACIPSQMLPTGTKPPAAGCPIPLPSQAGLLSTGPGTLGLSQQQLMQCGDEQSP